jgi:hypothetical protein
VIITKSAGVPRRQPRGFGLEHAAHLEQVVQRARLRAEQMHHRRERRLSRETCHERTLALRSLDDAARPQQLEPLSECGARDAELFREAPLGRQRLTGFEHPVNDQTFDALGNDVRHLAAVVV